jgi:hypothetical protein
MQRTAADDLDVVVTLAEHALGGFPNSGERIDHQFIEWLTVGDPLFELDGLRCEFLVRKSLETGFRIVDSGGNLVEFLEVATLAGPHQLGENGHTI